MDISRDPTGFLDRELNILFSNKSVGERMNWEEPFVRRGDTRSDSSDMPGMK